MGVFSDPACPEVFNFGASYATDHDVDSEADNSDHLDDCQSHRDLKFAEEGA